MFKKKKNKITYDINIYRNDKSGMFPFAYDVHLDGKLISTGTHSTISVAKYSAESVCKERAQLGKYKYTV